MGVCGACGHGKTSGGEAGSLEASVELTADTSYSVLVMCVRCACQD